MDSLVLLAVRLWSMRTGVHFLVLPTARPRLEAIVSAASSPQRHVWRARIILLSADAIGAGSIMVRTGKLKTCVWRWQERFMSEGVDGLLREKTPARHPEDGGRQGVGRYPPDARPAAT